MQATDADILTGWRIVVGALGILILLNLLGAVLPLLTQPSAGMTEASAGRLLLTALLAWPVYRGKRHAQFEVALLAAWAAAQMIFSASDVAGSLRVLWGCAGLLSLSCGLALVVLPQVGAYLEFAKAQEP
ncbi:hypothetical protein E7T06_06925 [Deinococcus sp. Arct2-2]|uniref:hypothetical protein n=1 Tax=Deinococcus sp. Arct2-2 TaxID=2568653 RepID=UPI0010A4772A|nr:hypothetical protein [Deinococcus sp. Arct2-2]THF70433.1 hypothetical protein E7T06_06925 [Deinococcus sp. Arct2-2]